MKKGGWQKTAKLVYQPLAFINWIRLLCLGAGKFSNLIITKNHEEFNANLQRVVHINHIFFYFIASGKTYPTLGIFRIFSFIYCQKRFSIPLLIAVLSANDSNERTLNLKNMEVEAITNRYRRPFCRSFHITFRLSIFASYCKKPWSQFILFEC